MNINFFPPMQWLFHHMITTFVYPKGGSRDEVTTVHIFFFYCLFHGIEVNLHDLMWRLIEQCHRYPNWVLPYAAHLTSMFARFASTSLANRKGQYNLQSGVYNRSFIMKFMGYLIQDNEVFRHRPSDSSSSNDEEDEDEEENEEDAKELKRSLLRLLLTLMTFTLCLWRLSHRIGGGVLHTL